MPLNSELNRTLLNGTTRFNAAVFYYDYSDYQSFSFAGLTPFVSNQDANVLGFEAELVTNPWEGWEFLFGVSVLDSEAEDVITDIAIGPNAGGIIVNNRDLVLAPDVTFNGLARYEWAMLGGIMSIQGDFSFVGEQYFDINNHPDSREGSYILGNARFAYTSPDDNYEISLAVKNLAGRRLPGLQYSSGTVWWFFTEYDRQATLGKWDNTLYVVASTAESCFKNRSARILFLIFKISDPGVQEPAIPTAFHCDIVAGGSLLRNIRVG